MPHFEVKVLGKTFENKCGNTSPTLCMETVLPSLVLVIKFPRLFTSKKET